ncbi:MAG: substrate-binding domain-containing protein [Anaerolineae bacterium]|nr:substrate-binding domain-containing protein [Anaerolineae bacterium]
MIKPHQRQSQSDRITIGVLTDWLGDEHPSLLLKGIISEARANDVNILCFVGQQPNHPERYASNANFIYDLPSAKSVDGLIVMSNRLSRFDPESVEQLCEKHQSLPIVSLGQRVEGVSSINVANEAGTCDAVSHLILRHGLHRIAYAMGPEKQLEAGERFQGYRRALKENGIAFDPSLVAPGGFDLELAEETIRVLLDERRVEFDAIVAANDLLAIGIIEQLNERGLYVPEDVAVIGFDDLDVAAACTPPLATVAQPIIDQGVEGVRALIAKIRGEPVPDLVVLPTHLVTRRSCGCLSPWVSGVKRRDPIEDGTNLIDLAKAWPETILAQVRSLVQSSHVRLPDDWPANLLTAFVYSSQEDAPQRFLLVLTYLLDEVARQRGKVGEWQGVISAVQQIILPSLNSPASRERADQLLHQARVLIGESVYQAQVGLEILDRRRMSLLRQVIFNLASTADFGEQLQILIDGLPGLGIRCGYLTLFEDHDPNAEWSNLVMAYTPERTFIADGDGIRFPTRQVIPEQYGQVGDGIMYTVQPIYYRNEYIGLLVLELNYDSLTAYELIRAVTSAAIKSGSFYQELQSYSQNLESVIRKATADLIQSKEQAENILNNSPDAILLLDKSGLIDVVNSTCSEVFGYSADELRGKHPSMLVSGELGSDVIKSVEQFAGNKGPIRFEVIAKPEKGVLFDAEVALAPVADGGIYRGAVCTIRDISALKDLERMKDALLSTAAHELRTPLTTIRGFSEILRTRDLTEERRDRYMGFIYEQSTHLGGLVDNLLDVARIQAGRGLEISFEMVDLEPILRSVVAAYREINSGHAFELVNLDHLPPVIGDPLRLDQVVRNLVSNAVKYSPGGGVVTITAAARDGRLEVSIRDEGIGMTPEQQSHLFERFYRADQSDSAIGGAGLGLTICKQIVEGHGGEIWVESEPGKGSTFTFSIPTVQHE